MTSDPTRSGIARFSAICTPQTGSRTSRRELVTCGSLAGAFWLRDGERKKPRSIQDTARRNIATVQNSTTSQIKNRINREENSFGVVSPLSIVCKGKRRSQTKSSDFNSLRNENRFDFGAWYGPDRP